MRHRWLSMKIVDKFFQWVVRAIFLLLIVWMFLLYTQQEWMMRK